MNDRIAVRLFLGLIFWTIYSRMKTRQCGFMVLDPGRCLLFPPARITASKGRINNRVDSGKHNSLHNNLGLWDIRTFTIPRRACRWMGSSKRSGKHLWEGLKVNSRSSRNRYGKTATNRGRVFPSSGQSEACPCDLALIY